MKLTEKNWYNTIIICLIIIVASQNLILEIHKERANLQHQATMVLFKSANISHDYIQQDDNLTKRMVQNLNILTKEYNDTH